MKKKFAKTFKKTFIASSIALLCANVVLAVPTQIPLLTRGSMVEPNIVFMIDDSGSMAATFLYQESNPAAWNNANLKITAGYGVMPRSDWNSYDYSISNVDYYAKCSPQINKIYYDPSTYYQPPFDSTGTGTRLSTALAPINNTSTGWGNGDGVCTEPITDIGNPVVYNYQGGDGPYWDGTKLLTANTSYKKVTIRPTTPYYKKFINRTDCAGVTTCTYAEESRNFANWYTWYRTRLDMAKTSIKEAFANQSAPFRLGWGKLNNLADNGKMTEGVTLYDSAKRTKFFTFLDKIGNGGDTPSRLALRTVGEYYKRKDTNGPWSNKPSADVTAIGTVPSNPNSVYATCRRANAMYITDGYYNDSTTKVSDLGIKDVDGDTNSSTFADVAMYYWITDLFPELDNKIKPVIGDNNDDAFWQHMNFWAIGLGVVGTIDISTLDKQKTELDAIKAGKKSWPVPAINKPSTLDDMWHATVNARGSFLNAGNAQELEAAINGMMGQMLKASSSQAGVAVSTANLDTGTAKYVPTYTTGNWSGNLIAYKLNTIEPVTDTDKKIGEVITPALWQAETLDPITEIETANTLCPSPANASACPANLSVIANTTTRATNRNIFVGNGATSGTRAVPFTYSDMNGAGVASTITPAYVGQPIDQTLISFLRGDKSQEGTNGSRAYRSRFTTLGDIVNSTPTFVKFAVDYGYSAQTGYTNFLATKAARSEGALFFGANDGMLHVLGESNGREIFAYVPKAVLSKVAQLALSSYGTNNNHLYFVDGPLTQGDYYNGSSWKNVVAGTTGAGAKAVFALDATTPTSMNASSVLWEVSNTTSGFTELGNVLHDVQIGLLRNGQWAAIFGNGYDSASKKAQLFIVNMNDGSLIKKIDTMAGSPTAQNGLGGVRLLTNPAGEIIGAYAGDLLGNMWKFDLYDTNSVNWGTGYGTTGAPKPLYTAKNAAGGIQPITATPYVMPHPSGGYLVAMSTGKLFEDSDLSDTSKQTAYGIRDTKLFGTIPIPNPSGASQVVGTSSLVKQTITATNTINQKITAFDGTTSEQAITFYRISSNTLDWTTKDGWYFDLPHLGQRTIFPVEALVSSLNRLVRVDTVQPGGVASDPCATATSAVGASYIIDMLTGGSPQGTLLDTNGDGKVIDSEISGTAVGTTAGSADAINASGYTTAADGRNIFIEDKARSTVTVKRLYDVSSDFKPMPITPDICALKLATTPLEIQSCCNQGGKNSAYYCSLTTQTKRTWRQLFMR
ncbi:MAG: type pilus assembly protein PilY1 [Pseudomonadota bacterium]|jgi:type IV pilus assembly protein PilY1